MRKAIFHVDEIEKWNMVIHNVQNMLNFYTQNEQSYHIEILANGPAVKEYKMEGANHGKDLASLSGDHVILKACNNALKSLKISHEDLFDFVMVVPAGVVELVEKQDEGYAYIKP